MLRPSLEEVKALAKQYNTIPVFYEFSADNQTPLNIYRAFSQESRNSFILESVSNGVQWDRYSFVGFSPKEEIRITGNTAEIRSGEKSETFEVAHPIAFLKERMAAYHSPVLEGAPNFTGGLIGYFGYVYDMLYGNSGGYPSYASAAAILLFTIVLTITCINLLVSKKHVYY